MNFKLSLISTALLTSFSVSAFAETEQPVKANTETLEQINVQDTGIKQNGYQTTGTSVVSKAEVPVFDTPNTVNILSTKLLEDRKPESLIDALYNVSGVSQANTLGGMFDAIQKTWFLVETVTTQLCVTVYKLAQQKTLVRQLKPLKC